MNRFSNGSAGRPCEIPSSEDVYVKMLYALTGAFSRIDDYSIPCLRDIKLVGDLRCRVEEVTEFR